MAPGTRAHELHDLSGVSTTDVDEYVLDLVVTLSVVDVVIG
jgi:hypothetical protein